MIGRSTYSVGVQDPYVMTCAAALGAAFGAAHGRWFAHTPRAFAHAWEAVGLTYANLSLLILSAGWHNEHAAAWIVVWGLAGVGQIIVGARLQDAVFTGFGVTAVAINLYTRYYERFWDQTDAGLFFLIGGALLFGTGFAIEWAARRSAAPAAEGAP
jgi:hypothetical protein